MHRPDNRSGAGRWSTGAGTTLVLARHGYRLFRAAATPWEETVRLARRRSRRQERTDAILASAERLSAYAHRWAVSRAADVSDAFVFDAACAVLAAHRTAGPQRTSSAATAERRKRYSSEEPADEFALPVTLEESARVLQRFARRHANGRGYAAAATVNALTRELLELGVDLSETRLRDGSLWAVNGRGPRDITLTPEQRREAESALPPRQREAH